MTAAIVPGTASQHFCISLARIATRRRASSKDIAPAAARAENSPSEWPATMSGRKLSVHAARMVECRKMAGWVTLVAFRSSSVPSNMMRVISKPSISSALSKNSRALVSLS